jgi:hypothetical protein
MFCQRNIYPRQGNCGVFDQDSYSILIFNQKIWNFCYPGAFLSKVLSQRILTVAALSDGNIKTFLENRFLQLSREEPVQLPIGKPEIKAWEESSCALKEP